jgi:hypothetical protein
MTIAESPNKKLVLVGLERLIRRRARAMPAACRRHLYRLVPLAADFFLGVRAMFSISVAIGTKELNRHRVMVKALLTPFGHDYVEIVSKFNTSSLYGL